MGGSPLHKVDHLWIVINEPSLHGDEALFVNVTTYVANVKDATTLLHVGDHPFIKHQSCINYGAAKSAATGKMDQLVATGLFRINAPASAALIARIRNDALSAPTFPSKYLSLL